MILDRNGNPIKSNIANLHNDIATREIVEAIANLADLMPHPSRVLKTISKQIIEFEKTLLQPDVSAASLNIHDGVKALQWDVSQAQEDGPRAAWFKSLFKSLPNIPEICSNAVSAREFGYTVFEVMWAKDGNTVIPITITEKPREWFLFDQAGNLRLITKENKDGILLDEKYPRKFILIRHGHSYKNPYGLGLLEIVYWLVQGLNNNFEWLLQFLEDDGRDHWIAYVSQDANQNYINKVQTALSVLRRRSVAVLFEGVRAEQKENRGRKSSSDVFTAFDSLAVTKINKLWMGSDLSMQLGDVGARASSQTGSEIRDGAIKSSKTLAEELFNTVIRWTKELNKLPGSDDEELSFVLSKPAQTTKEQAEIDKIYAQSTGKKVGLKLLARRGYEEGDFDDATPATPNPVTVFSNGYDIDPLLSAAEGLKKKH